MSPPLPHPLLAVTAPLPGMNDTLDMFQREWYRLSGEGKISAVDLGTVPDIYLRNQQLGDELRNMGTELNRMQVLSSCIRS